MPSDLISSLLASSPHREILDCSVAWTSGSGLGHLLSTQVTGVVRQRLATHPTTGVGARAGDRQFMNETKDERWRDKRSASGSRPMTMKSSTRRRAKSSTR